MSVFIIIKTLLPVIRDIIKSAQKDSIGGKKVTRQEVEDLLIDHLPLITDLIVDEMDKG